MKPHRLSDLLADLHRRINPAYGPGRQKEEFVRALEEAGIRPEHGNRGDELETMVLVDQKELSRLRSSPAPVVGGVPEWKECVDIANKAQLVTGRSIWPSTVQEILRVYLASRLLATCAGAGGVPELEEPDGERTSHVYGLRCEDIDRLKQFGNPVLAAYQEGVRKGYMLLVSRLPALKPGEVEVNVEFLESCAMYVKEWQSFTGNLTSMTDIIKDLIYRAQFTTIEKEAEHV